MSATKRVDFDDIKTGADFAVVLTHYEARGELRVPKGARGEQLKVHCPFHDDDTPSLSINLGRKLFHCFNEGACGASDNVLEFVHRMEAEGGRPCSLREAANSSSQKRRTAGSVRREVTRTR